ncbi:Slit robo rho gtpase activating protein 1 [Fasciolopsis buskii]|uniref:Slit robo rho gtpase activating protein 1 n=1 Tax=Fasciolopsis buskii TaxID=27845 RepID=A0A8E0RR63_9TREM|nr:Slit robo rho gtpase activating protein 1 [Fasciolopsis buski]
MKSAPLFLHSDLVDTDRSADQASSLDGDVHHVQDGENSCDDLKSISDSESSENPYTLAVAQADFTGSTPRELSFQQGDDLFLYRRLNDHWWEGQVASDTKGTRGLVPHLYVIPKAALACLAGLGGSDSGAMERSQYDGIEDEDENDEDEGERDGEDNEEGEEREYKNKSSHTELSTDASDGKTSVEPNSSKPALTSDVNEAVLPATNTKLSDSVRGPPVRSEQSTPAKIDATDSISGRADKSHDSSSSSLSALHSATPTHSNKLVVSPSNLPHSLNSPERVPSNRRAYEVPTQGGKNLIHLNIPGPNPIGNNKR